MSVKDYAKYLAYGKYTSLAMMVVCFVAYFYPILFFIPALYCFFISIVLNVLQAKAEELEKEVFGAKWLGATAVGLFGLFKALAHLFE